MSERVADDRLATIEVAGRIGVRSGTMTPVLSGELVAIVYELRDLRGRHTPLTHDERTLVVEVCHDLINRAMRMEDGSHEEFCAAAEYRAKERAIRKLLGDAR